MRTSFIKLKLVLICAIFVLFISMFANRIAMAKSQNLSIQPISIQNSIQTEYELTTSLVGVTRDVYQKINQQRRKKRLRILRWDEDLADLAYDYSKQMAKEKFFSHYDRDGNSIVERIENYDIRNWKKVGENLFQSEGYADPANIAVKGWLRSSSHRKNIYDREWTHTGIGVYKTRRGETYITQVFLRQ